MCRMNGIHGLKFNDFHPFQPLFVLMAGLQQLGPKVRWKALRIGTSSSIGGLLCTQRRSSKPSKGRRVRRPRVIWPRA